MSTLSDKLGETVAFIRKRYEQVPEVGIVLGSGLGNFLSEINIEASISYAEIPHFPVSTVAGHQGMLVFGDLNNRKVVAMAGRFHYYEGYSVEEVVFPVRVMKMLGIKNLLLSNAAGGVNPAFQVGDLMLITDHISLGIVNPLIGPNDDSIGPRFPDMSEPYRKDIIEKARKIGEGLNIKLQSGVYYAVTGPTFESHAEYRMIHRMGADAVGMSTVQECIVANHMQLPVFAVSVITDMGLRDDDNTITHEEVLEAAAAAEPKLTALFRELVGQL